MDTFARDNLPPREQWPDLLEMDYPPQLNAAVEPGYFDQPANIKDIKDLK